MVVIVRSIHSIDFTFRMDTLLNVVVLVIRDRESGETKVEIE